MAETKKIFSFVNKDKTKNKMKKRYFLRYKKKNVPKRKVVENVMA